MSIVNILTRQTPTIAGYEFDAVLEDTLISEVTHSGYVIEIGARASDHRIVQPKQWILRVGISNNPLKVQLTDFVGAASYVDTDSGLLAAAAGLSAGFLSGSSNTRAANALEFLLELQLDEPFDIDAGDIQLSNMQIDRITRTKDAENENALIAVCELSESPRLATTLSINNPNLSLLNASDSSYTSAVATVDKGEVVGSAASESTASSVTEVLG